MASLFGPRALPAPVFVETPLTASTNDDARELALAGAPHGSVVLAAAQSAGRGRAGRAFASPTGGLYMSVVLRPRAPPHHWSALPLLAGAAFAAVLRARGFPAEIKWPNDILMGRKLGGVLVESRMGMDPFAIAGIGANLAEAPKDVPGATCLAQHGEPLRARPLAEEIRDALLARVARLDAEGPTGVLPEARALCATLGRRVVWEKGEGVAVDIADDGALVVVADGRPTRILAGDVRLKVV